MIFSHQPKQKYAMLAGGTYIIQGTLQMAGSYLVATDASTGISQIIAGISPNTDALWASGERLYGVTKHGVIYAYWLQADASGVISLRLESTIQTALGGGVYKIIGDIDAIAIIMYNGEVHIAACSAAGQWVCTHCGHINPHTTNISIKDRLLVLNAC